MPTYKLDNQNGLFYLHSPPCSEGGRTFVFFNALTGDTGMWEGSIGESLRAQGHGTLSFNFRGQTDSPFEPGTALNAGLIVEDARQLLSQLAPERVILTGLSIGGLFAAQAWLEGLAGVNCHGLVLINTLRCDGPRLRWINDALVRCVQIGGLALFRDLYAPLLFNQDWQASNRDKFLGTDSYTALTEDSGHFNLLQNAGATNWDIPYEKLSLPVLLITGLQDRVFLDLQDVETLAARIPDVERVDLDNAAHLLPAERPAELVELLLKFAGRV
jgi:pimeloyl-ACP methyl ester carboxylesterase